jgi:hypothetical protein
MSRKNPVAEEAETTIRFTHITAGGDGELYAIDDQGRVFVYLEDDSSNGWFQLPHDEVRVALGDDGD